MWERTRLAAPALLLRWIFLCWLFVPPLDALPSRKDAWIEVRTPHFTILSAGSRPTALAVGRNLEQLRTLLGDLAGFELRSPVPTYVYVFPSNKKLRPYKPLRNGKPIGVDGFFLSRTDANMIAIHSDTPFLERLVFHEYVHEVTGNNFPVLPPWLDEGLAEYYSHLEVAGNRYRVGILVRDHLLWLLEHGVMPLEKLFAIDESSPEYHEGTRLGGFYAQSWALVHYLFADEERRGQLRRYLELLGEGRERDAAFAEAFGTDYEGLRLKLRVYLRTRARAADTITLAPLADDAFELREVGYPEALHRLGELLASYPERAADAAKHYRAALEERPGDPRALAGLGRLAGLRGDDAEALAHLERAAAAAPDDFLVQYRYGEQLAAAPDDPARRARAKAALRRATELAPDLGPGWAQLAFVAVAHGEVTASDVRAGETARLLLPSRDDVVRSLMVLYTRNGRREAAARLYDEHFAGAASAETQRRARAVLVAVDLQEAQRRVDEGRYEEALALYEGVAQRAAGTRDGTAAAARAREIAEVVEYNRRTDVYNQAVRHFNAMRLGPARQLLEALLAELPEGEELRGQTLHLLRRIRSLEN